eukprot:13759335-Ditylum_brightwellii.AAC.1
MNVTALLPRWKEDVSPSTPSVPIYKSTSSASKTTMVNGSTDLDNLSQPTRSVLYRGQEQILTEEKKIERRRKQQLEKDRRRQEKKKQSR